MKHNIELHYTGGGVTLVEAEISEERYAVVSSEAPEFLAVYKQAEDETPYLPENMVASLTEQDMDKETKKLYKEMLGKLKQA
jgi:hypothetical protein